MVAGKISVSRRRGYGDDDWFSREYYGGDHRSSYNNSSCERKFDVRRNERNGFSCAEGEREQADLWRANGVKRSSRRIEEDGIRVPVEKKRKFSPIIWDLGNKVKNSVKIRHQSVDNASSVVVSNVDAIESKRPTALSPSLHLGEDGDHGGQQGQGAVEEFVEIPSLAMSRWASEDDSSRETILLDDEGMLGKPVHKKSTPESGELISEVSDGSLMRSSGSSGKGENSRDEDEDEDEDEEMQVIQMDSDEDLPGNNVFQGCRNVSEFERLNEINEGAYGKVFKARDKKTGELVALKKLKMDVGGHQKLECGFLPSALREINILWTLHHPSIVNLREVVVDNFDGIYIVMEYMDHDLKGLIGTVKYPFSTSEVKCLMLQLLEGVKDIHDKWVIHRDLKTSNLLMNNQGELKICDFGISRRYGSPLKPYSSNVVTLWYRAPELLLETKQYSTAIDMWSVGCIMAELLAKEPLFKGNTDIDQLDKIFRTLGTPDDTTWPGFSRLPGAEGRYFVKHPGKLLRKKFPAASFTGLPILSDLGFDLLSKLLEYDPEKRITADAALSHPWFHEVPLAKCKKLMPTFPPRYARNRILQRTIECSYPNMAYVDPRSKGGGRQCQGSSVFCIFSFCFRTYMFSLFIFHFLFLNQVEYQSVYIILITR